MSEEKKAAAAGSYERVWTVPFLMIFINSMVMGCTSWAVVPLMSSYAMELGADLKTASFIASLMSMTAMFLRPVSGFVVDRTDRKKMVIITTACNIALAVIHIFASDIRMLGVCRVLQGMVFSFSGVASTAFSTYFVPASRLGEGMGWMALAQVISQSIGPSIGLFLYDNFGYHANFIFAAAASLLSLFILRFVPYEQKTLERPEKKLSLNDIISFYVLPYALIAGLFSGCNGLDNTFLALLGKERGIENFAAFFTAYSAVMFLARPISGKLLDRFGLRYVIFPAMFCTASSAVLTGSAKVLPVLIAAGMMKGIGQSSGSPSIQATCLKKLGKEKAGLVSSTCLIGQDIGNTLAPILGGIAAQKWGYRTMYWGYAAILFFGGSLIYILKSSWDRRHETPASDSTAK